MIEVGEIPFSIRLKTLIFGLARPWGLVHWILEGRSPGVPKTLTRFEAKSFQTRKSRFKPSQASQGPPTGGTGDQLPKQRTRKNSKSLRDFEFFLAESLIECTSEVTRGSPGGPGRAPGGPCAPDLLF